MVAQQKFGRFKAKSNHLTDQTDDRKETIFTSIFSDPLEKNKDHELRA